MIRARRRSPPREARASLRRRACALAAAALVLGGAPAAGAGTEEPGRGPAGLPGKALAHPGESPVISAGRIEQSAPGELVLTEEVDFRYGIARLLADSVRYSEAARTAIAEGNVVLQLGATQVSGDRIEVNVETGYALIENGRAYLEPDVLLEAERLERIGEETFRITRGTITTCTQPTPYWSFHVGSAVVNLGRYAHMRNASFRVGRVPAFWSPYLVWPVKEDRAAGLLLPHVGYTRKRGAFISNGLYLPLGRSADATLQFDFFNGAVSGLTEQLPQSGQGLELRFVPAEGGSGALTAYFLRERLRPDPGADVLERNRYHVNLAHTQRLASDFKLLADLNAVSDLDYFLDFEREIRYSTSPTVYSQVDLSRQAGPLALNVRLNRQVQFLNVVQVDAGTRLTEDLTLSRLPEVEVRGRGIRLGRSRFYLTFESSIDGLSRRTRLVDPNLDALVSETGAYARFDLFPVLSGNFTPVPWLDISPTLAVRETFYTASDRDPGPDVDIEGGPIHREQYRFGVAAVGPRLFRLFGSAAPGATRYKHTFETRIAYDYVPQVTGSERIVPFDEIDTALPSSNLLTYSLTSRLFAKRPPRPAAPPADSPALPGSFAALVLGEEPPSRHQELVPPAAAGPPPPAAPAEPSGAEAREPGAEEAPSAPPAPPEPRGGETYIPPDVSTGPGERAAFGAGRAPAGAGAPAGGRAPGVGPMEIATFDLTQRYSLDALRPLSASRALRAESHHSPVEATIRFNPTYAASADLRASYNILHDDIESVSLSGNLRARDRGYLRLSWFFRRDLEGRASGEPGCVLDPTRVEGREGPDTRRCFADSSQIRLLGGFALLGRKITADLEGSYDIENAFLRDQRYRVGYNTQCCGVLVEMARRSFQTSVVGATSELEYRFVLNLRGVGTFLDLNGRPR